MLARRTKSAGAGSTTANALATTGADVNVSNAAPPETGDDFYATSATQAAWGKKLPRKVHVQHNKYSNLACDGKEYYYSAINAGSVDLYCTDGAFVTGQDEGKFIGIERAGTGGGWHNSTIATVVSPTHVTIANAAVNSVNTIHTVADEITTYYGTDDIPAYQLLLNSLFSSSSGVWDGNFATIFPNALTIFASPLQTSVTGFSSTPINPNSQVYIPNLPYDPSSGNKPEFSFRSTILIKGETRPYFHGPNSIGNAQSARSGARIRSTLTSSSGSFPSIICAKGGASTTDNWAQFNSVGLEIEDIIFEMTTDSSNRVHMSAINGDRAKYTRYTRCNAYPHNFTAASTAAHPLAAPVSNTIGFIPAGQGDELGNVTKKCLAVGFDYGFLSGEHFAIRDCMAWACNTALGLIPTHIPVVIDNLEGTGCKYYLGYAGPIVSDIWGGSWNKAIVHGTINGEISTSAYSAAWYYDVAHINDSGNQIYGHIDLLNSVGGTGYAPDRAAKIGGQNLKVTVVQPFDHVATHSAAFAIDYLYQAQQVHKCTNAASINMTLYPTNTASAAGYKRNFEIGAKIEVLQYGAGQVVPVASGCTVTLPAGMTGSGGQYKRMVCEYIGGNEWIVYGDLA